MPLLFSYGSNNPTQLGERLGRPIGGKAAFLEGYGRVFRAWSKRWNGGVASLEEDSSRKTYGYVERVTEEELKILDGWEKGYQRIPFQVHVAKGDGWETKTAIAYVCLSKTYNKPSRQYLEAIIKTINAFWSDDHEITVDNIPLKRNPEHPHSFSHPLAYTCFGGDLRTYWDEYSKSYRTAYTPEDGIADTRAWLVGQDPEEAKRAHYELAVELGEDFRRNPDEPELRRPSMDEQILIAERDYRKEPTEWNWIRLNTLLNRAGLPLVGNEDGENPCEFCLETVAEDGCHQCEVLWCFNCRYEHECPYEKNPSYRRNADADHRKLERRIKADGDITVLDSYANSLIRHGLVPDLNDASQLATEFREVARQHPNDWPQKVIDYAKLSAKNRNYLMRIFRAPITTLHGNSRIEVPYLPGDKVLCGGRQLPAIIGGKHRPDPHMLCPCNFPGGGDPGSFYVIFDQPMSRTPDHWTWNNMFPKTPL
jgi:hypothetical protein